jgi:hypothetical protein
MTSNLQEALNTLHLSRGAPSSRSISNAINTSGNKISHTTVNAILRGESHPRWENLKLVIEELEGDIKLFERLWQESAAQQKQSNRQFETLASPPPAYSKPIANSQTSGDVSVFVSYAHKDDRATHGRIRALAEGIARAYESLTGLEVGVFFDTQSIDLGANWRDRIMAGLDSSTVLLSFISPSYLNSISCRAEVSSFMSFLADGRTSRLIIPILLFPRERIDRYFSKDALWQEILNLQHREADDLWTETPGSQLWIDKTMEIAVRIEVALDRQDEENKKVIPSPETEQIADTADGVLDQLAYMETGIFELGEMIAAYGQLISQQSDVVATVTPKLVRAPSFTHKLVLARETAKQLTPLADEALIIAKEAREKVTRITPGVLSLIKLTYSQRHEEPDVAEQVSTMVKEASKQSINATDTFESLARSLPKAKGFSKDLDDPLTTLERALLIMAETRANYVSWVEAAKRPDGLS